MSSLATRLNDADTPSESFSSGELEQGPAALDSNDRIREIAYFLWLDAGCPEGEEERHWAAAQALHQAEPTRPKHLER